MIDKIIWTKTAISNLKSPQLEFQDPTGYKIYSNKSYTLKPETVTEINLNIKLYTENAVTLFFNIPNLVPDPDYSLVNTCFVLSAKSSFEMKFGLLNIKQTKITVSKNQFITNFIILNQNFINLFEVNSSEFEQYA